MSYDRPNNHRPPAATAPSAKNVAPSAANPYASPTAGDPGSATTYTSAATAPQIAASIPPRNNGKSGVSSAGTNGPSPPSPVNPVALGSDLDYRWWFV